MLEFQKLATRLVYQTAQALGEKVSNIKADGKHLTYRDEAEMTVVVSTSAGRFTVPANVVLEKLQHLLEDIANNHMTYEGREK